MQADIVVPALNLRGATGSLDETETAEYARRAASTWIDRFILSGTTTQGEAFSEAERAVVLDLWCDVAPPGRLLACCWSARDVENAQRRGIAPIVVMRDLQDHASAVRFLQALAAEAYVYSHPTHSRTVLDAQLCANARDAGFLPAGAKVAKVTRDCIRRMRAEVGTSFALWDASSRNVRASVNAGASGVVATPLSLFASPFPPRHLPAVQATVDKVQEDLDRMPREARNAYLTRCAQRQIHEQL
jgi:hypothetical protein